MPIYEYRCQDCGHYVDVLQKLSDDPLRTCPSCEADSLKRLVSAPAFRLKGGGWYETDFKSDKEKRRNLADGGDGQAKDSEKSSDKPGGGEAKSAEGAKKDEGSKKKSSESGGSGKAGDKSAKPGDGAQSKAAV